MMKKADSPEDLAPWYANQTLTQGENDSYEIWLESHPEAKVDLRVWQDIRRILYGQPRLTPPSGVFKDIKARIERYDSATSAGWHILLATFSGIAVGLVVFLLLWLVVKPVITLQWSINGETPASFRIYRAPAGSEVFIQVGEILAQENQLVYQYSDLLSMPGRSYQYRLEGINKNGGIEFSRAVTNDPQSGLPGQLSILVISLIMGYVGISLLKFLPGFPPRRSGGVMA